MKKQLYVLLVSFLLCPSSKADEWTGPDKTQHAIVGAIIGAAVTIGTEDPLQGCLVSSAVGAAKEIYDKAHPDKHTASFKDFAVTALFGCSASYFTGLIVTPNSIQYSFRF